MSIRGLKRRGLFVEVTFPIQAQFFKESTKRRGCDAHDDERASGFETDCHKTVSQTATQACSELCWLLCNHDAASNSIKHFANLFLTFFKKLFELRVSRSKKS